MLMPFISGTTDAYTDVDRISPSRDPADRRVTAAFWSPLKLVPFGMTVTVIAPSEAFLTSSAKCFAVTPTDEVIGSGIDSWIFAEASPLLPALVEEAALPVAQPARRVAAAVIARAAVMRVLVLMSCMPFVFGRMMCAVSCRRRRGSGPREGPRSRDEAPAPGTGTRR